MMIMQLFQIYNYVNVTKFNLMRKRKLLLENMVRIDKDHENLLKIKMKNIKRRLKIIIFLVPKELRFCRSIFK